MSTPSARGLRTWQWVLALTAALIAGVVVWATRPEPVPVRVAPVGRSDVETTVATVGNVVPVHQYQARSAFSGIVEKIHVQLGQKVAAGQLLVSLKDPFAHARIDADQAALQSAKLAQQNIQNNGTQEDRINFEGDRTHAQLDEADAIRSLAIMKDLHSKGDATAAEVTAAQERLASIQANLQTIDRRLTDRYSPAERAAGQARVLDARAQLAAEKENFSNVEIASPMAGTVYLIPVQQYDFVPGGAELMRIADLRAMEVHANFDEPDIGKLRVGQPVKIAWDGKPHYAWHGHILHAPIAVVTDGQRRVGECVISLDDDTQEFLPADTTVTVTVTLQKRVGVATIPREALHVDGRGAFVFRVVRGTLLRTPVGLGLIALDKVEITAGLSQNDVVALNALTDRELTDGLKVQPAN